MKDFGENLLIWYRLNKRDLPWRETTDPYKIWLSEIILQQTRVIQGMNYFYQFVNEFPDVQALANAPQDKIYKMWQGLGYYNRAENLMKAAKTIVEKYQGKFPCEYDELLKIKGIGSYTAAAISSIAFNVARPVVDGNVFRVLSRIFGIETPVNTTKSKKEFELLAGKLMDTHPPGEFNQALMEFGALYCTVNNPDCENCIFKNKCYAFKNRLVNHFPVKNPKIPPKKIFFYFFVIEIINAEGFSFYIKRRSDKDIWRNLYDFPSVEFTEPVEVMTVLNEFLKIINQTNAVVKNISNTYVHQLTHRQINATFIRLIVDKLIDISDKNSLLLVSERDIEKYPVPRLLEKYLTDQKII